MPQSPDEEIPRTRAVDDWVPWLAGLLQLIAAVGWLCAWMVVVFRKCWSVQCFPRRRSTRGLAVFVFAWLYQFKFGRDDLRLAVVLCGGLVPLSSPHQGKSEAAAAPHLPAVLARTITCG
ncbi:hypothetical protein Pr1d_32700 [Bythopirellula goksoeyrii]|uniref:Uncharacterized protein n=1 Tax=Bythopirellula goksoeyrii TaxID=1400387 RepID=A0A5B9QPC1_9BACT|nr:hypothetical protein Pr1d_32700 [Bythopirellula goksoeyrii]